MLLGDSTVRHQHVCTIRDGTSPPPDFRLSFSMRAASLVASAILFALVASACGSPQPLSRPASSLAEVNGALADRGRVHVHVAGEDRYRRASLVSVSRDSVYFVPEYTAAPSAASRRSLAPTQVSTARVDSIRIKYDGGGGRTGAAIGATPGLVWGLSHVPELSQCEGGWCALGRMVVGVITLGSMGLGALFGALVGNDLDNDVQTVYRGPVDRYLSSTNRD